MYNLFLKYKNKYKDLINEIQNVNYIFNNLDDVYKLETYDICMDIIKHINILKNIYNFY